MATGWGKGNKKAGEKKEEKRMIGSGFRFDIEIMLSIWKAFILFLSYVMLGIIISHNMKEKRSRKNLVAKRRYKMEAEAKMMMSQLHKIARCTTRAHLPHKKQSMRAC